MFSFCDYDSRLHSGDLYFLNILVSNNIFGCLKFCLTVIIKMKICGIIVFFYFFGYKTILKIFFICKIGLFNINLSVSSYATTDFYLFKYECSECFSEISAYLISNECISFENLNIQKFEFIVFLVRYNVKLNRL